MKPSSIAFLLAAAGLAAGVSGQIITTPGVSATFSLNWIEDPAFVHNDNGVLEPGEHALIRTNVSFSNQFQFVNFSPLIGTFTSGIVVGLGSGAFDIRSLSPDASGVYNNGVTVPPSTSIGPDANSTGTNGFGVREPFRIAGDGSNGTPVANGFVNIQAAQFVPGPSQILQTNPIVNTDRLGWVPNSYTTRTVNFAVAMAAGQSSQVGLYLDLNGSLGDPGPGYIPGTISAVAYLPLSGVSFGSVNIPVAPAPGGLALLGLTTLAASRRRGRARGGVSALELE